jgi:hypothetical protein
MKRVFRRPSPAMLVAIAALIVALGGTAVAGGVLNKKKVNNIISNRAPGLSVGSAKNADSAKTADNLSDQTLQIRAWARVNADGTLGASKNVTSESRPATGRYCFDVPFTPNGAVASVRGDAGNFSSQILVQVNDTSLCPAGQRDVRIYTANGGADANTGFVVYIN